MQYKKEIDGLRALAVLPVILYHAGIERISGGFLGVDVFFVISGYLITSIILSELAQGKFSLIKFYERRVRRILPPLFITIIFTLIVSFFVFIPTHIKDVGQSVVATNVYLSNYFFYLETDYFNQFTNHAPLLHTWSLAVEEQFYFIFPVLLILFFRINNRKLFLLLYILLIVSFVASVNLVKTDAQLAFYSIHSRAWELMIGALLAFNTEKIQHCLATLALAKRLQLSEVVSWVAFIGLMWSYLFVNIRDYGHPSFITLIPVIAAGLIIVFSGETKYFKAVIGHKWLVFIGLVSYGLYLYHNPVYSFITYQNETDPEFAFHLKLAVLPVILLVAYMSYRFIETPIRKGSVLKRAPLFLSAALISVSLAIVGYVFHKTDGFQAYFLNKYFAGGGHSLINIDKEKQLIEEVRQKYPQKNLPFICDSAEDCTKILVIGDSFGEDAFLAMSTIRPKTVALRTIYFDDPCMKTFNVDQLNGQCMGGNISLANIKDADIVLITAKWQESTYQDGYLMAKAIQERFKKRVVVSGSVMFSDISSMTLRAAKLGVDVFKSKDLVYKNVRWDRISISNKLRKIVQEDKNLVWIEKYDFFCAATQCTVFLDDGSPLIWDNAHLTVKGYPLFGEFLFNHLL